MNTLHKQIQAVVLLTVTLGISAPAYADYLSDGILIRRVAPTSTCGVKGMFTDPSNLDRGRADNLSVNCHAGAKLKKSDYANYLTGLLPGNYCVAEIKRVVQKGGLVRPDPVTRPPVNPLHCLLDGISAKDLANIVTPFP
jgi:hypothetical protein